MKKTILICAAVFMCLLPLAAQTVQPLNGSWRLTYQSEDPFVVAEFLANISVDRNNAVTGTITARPSLLESAIPEAGGAADENMVIRGTLKAGSAVVSYTIPSCGMKMTARISIDGDSGRLLWQALTGSPGPSYVPTSGELYRLDYASAMEEASFYDGQQDFTSALFCYFKAAAAKPDDIEALYNIASNLALVALWYEGPEADPQEYDIYSESRAVYALKALIEKNPSVKTRAEKDPVWNPLRKRVTYLCNINGFDLYDREKLPDLLRAVGTWYEPPIGVGPGRELVFKKGGACLIRNARNADGELTTLTGTWMTSGDVVSVRIIGGDTEDLTFGSDNEWGLTGVGTFFDHQIDQGGM